MPNYTEPKSPKVPRSPKRAPASEAGKPNKEPTMDSEFAMRPSVRYGKVRSKTSVRFGK